MNREILEKALSQVSNRHLESAAKAKRRPLWIPAIAAATAAAILALVLIGGFAPKYENPHTGPFAGPVVNGNIRMAAAPRNVWADYKGKPGLLDEWTAIRTARKKNVKDALKGLNDFFTRSTALFLAGEGNQLWSPANAYIGLAMLAELTEGESQKQLLKLFGAGSIEELRKQVSAVFETVYDEDEYGICKLANSLWLQEGLSYKDSAMDALAHHYYASIHGGDLDSAEIGKAIADWLNANTGGLLKDYPPAELDANTVLALYSTLYFQSQWGDRFYEKGNTTGAFHSPSGDRIVTYMNQDSHATGYYWGDNFSALTLRLENGSTMWFILPDEGKTTDDLLSDGQYMDMLLTADGQWKNHAPVLANLSVPKFDVSGKQDLVPGLKKLGLTDIFSPEKANFSAITGDVPLAVTGVNQAVRVQIDEEGVTGASYVEIFVAGSVPPTGEVVDFILDRPFLFAITSGNIPLFTGVVNEP